MNDIVKRARELLETHKFRIIRIDQSLLAAITNRLEFLESRNEEQREQRKKETELERLDKKIDVFDTDFTTMIDSHVLSRVRELEEDLLLVRKWFKPYDGERGLREHDGGLQYYEKNGWIVNLVPTTEGLDNESKAGSKP